MSAVVELCSERPPTEVTIADIAKEARLTSAAVYYHFATKDEVIVAAMREVADSLVDHLTQLLRSRGQADLSRTLVDGFLDWIETTPDAARLYFVSSVGTSPAVEALRRDVRNRLVPLLARAVRRSLGGGTKARGLVGGVALISLLETAAGARLAENDLYRDLGHDGLREYVRELADRVCRD